MFTKSLLNISRWKSADNLCIYNSDGIKRMKSCPEETSEGNGEGTSMKKSQHQRLSASVSASPYLGGTQLSNTNTAVLHPIQTNEIQPNIAENSNNGGENWHHNTEGKNISPTHLTVNALYENGGDNNKLR